MSHAFPTSPVPLPQPLVDGTTRAIELALRPPPADRDGHLLDSIQRLCADARRLNVRPEELIVLFKAGWRSHATLHHLPREEANRLLDEIITSCIKEYYRDGLRA
jgi:hypothetical protein